VLSGYNTDVVFEQTVLHVQSEDRGESNPVLESLVYCGGQILHHERTEYSDWLSGDEDTDADALRDQIAERLERQHRDLVRRARHGEFLLDAARRFDVADEGEALLETVRGLLREAGDLQPLELTWSADMVAYGGVAGRLQVQQGDGEPAAGVRVLARVLGRGLEPVEVFEGETGPDGGVDVAVALPPAGATALLFRAEDGGAGGRLRIGLGSRVCEGEGDDEEVATTAQEGEPTGVC
jgi:hypothetical protein